MRFRQPLPFLSSDTRNENKLIIDNVESAYMFTFVVNLIWQFDYAIVMTQPRRSITNYVFNLQEFGQLVHL